VGFASCKPADALVFILLEHFRVASGFQVQVLVLYALLFLEQRLIVLLRCKYGREYLLCRRHQVERTGVESLNFFTLWLGCWCWTWKIIPLLPAYSLKFGFAFYLTLVAVPLLAKPRSAILAVFELLLNYTRTDRRTSSDIPGISGVVIWLRVGAKVS